MVSVTVVMAQTNGRQGQVKDDVELNQYRTEAPHDNTNDNTDTNYISNTNTDAAFEKTPISIPLPIHTC